MKAHSKIIAMMSILVIAYLVDVATAGIAMMRRMKPPGNMYETIVACFGSRYSLNPRPQDREWYQAPAGRFRDEHVETILGLRVDERIYTLPFHQLNIPIFSKVQQTVRPCTLIWRAIIPEASITLTISIIAPFYPRDAKLSTAPFFYVDFAVENLSERKRNGMVIYARALDSHQLNRLRLARDIAIFESTGAFDAYEAVTGDGWEIECAQLDMALQVRGVSSEKFLICTWNFELQPNEKCKRTLMLAAYSDEAFFTAKSYPYRFKYTEWFKSIRDVLDYARSDEMRIRRRVKIFEATWLDASFPESLKRLSSFAFHNWVANTLWLIPASDVASERGIEANPPFAEWFSVLEGGGGFYNSTVDVEYNFAPFYLLYYPELLRMVLREWIAYREPGLIRHDMGAGFIANGMSYYHDMPVEENTNYLLLLFALWATSGDNSLLKQHWDVVREVVAYLTNTDTDGNGFPNDGTSNTIDQGSWVVQHAPEQVYLANKMAAAYQAVELMSRVKGDAELADVCRRHRVVINATMHRNAWLGDHYAVCLDRSVIGWDSYSIYAGNGWLYPFMMGIAPDADLVKLRFDIVNSTKRTWRTFGSTHTNRESNLWISQNIWRDCIAAYLGVDMLDHVDAYWNLQHRLNRSLGGAFVDSYNCEDGWGSLTYYPRGLTCTAYFFAISRMHFNRATHRVSFQPLRLPLRIPLLQLADWERERIPWVEFERAGERITIKCTEPDLVRGWEIKVRDPIIAQ